MTEWNFFKDYPENYPECSSWFRDLSDDFYKWFDENFYSNIPEDTWCLLNRIKIKKLPKFLTSRHVVKNHIPKIKSQIKYFLKSKMC